ncbi:hypothetical protein FKM82_019514 [Ascaphus truei]
MHITIMNLLLWVILLSLPSFIYWLKNLRYTMQLYPDPNRFVTLILIFTLEILMNSSTSSIKSRYSYCKYILTYLCENVGTNI